MMDIKDLITEQRNPNSTHIDTMETIELVRLINREDSKVSSAIERKVQSISSAIDQASSRYNKGGRLIYCGAGTSGRLGVLDAAELVPTYGIKPERAVGLIAGGLKAMFKSVEGAEDSTDLAESDLKNIELTDQDTVISIAASGRTPYAIGAINYANSVGALSVAVTCAENSNMGKLAKIAIEVEVGPEVITGSTRMKAGTAQKMVLNIISTGVMVKSGKVFQNLMIDVQPSNNKLVDRATRIISAATGKSIEEASELLKRANNHVNVAIVMGKTDLDLESAKDLLKQNDGIVGKVILNWKKN